MRMTREQAIEKLQANRCRIHGEGCQWVKEGFGTCDECEVGVALRYLKALDGTWDSIMEDIQVIKIATKAVETRLRDLRFPEESEEKK